MQPVTSESLVGVRPSAFDDVGRQSPGAVLVPGAHLCDDSPSLGSDAVVQLPDWFLELDLPELEFESRYVVPFVTLGRLMPPIGRPLTTMIEITVGLTAAGCANTAAGAAIAATANAMTSVLRMHPPRVTSRPHVGGR